MSGHPSTTGTLLVLILTPVNGEFELLGKFGRCFITRVDRLRSSGNNSTNREISSSVGNYFFPNFGSSI
jgi:hypothetical protein